LFITDFINLNRIKGEIEINRIDGEGCKIKFIDGSICDNESWICRKIKFTRKFKTIIQINGYG